MANATNKLPTTGHMTYSQATSCVWEKHFPLICFTWPVQNNTYGLSFFPLIYGPSAKHMGHKSTGKIKICNFNSTDWENEVSKIFIVSLRLIRYAGKETSWLFKFTVAGYNRPYNRMQPQNWPTTAHVLTERYNNAAYAILHTVWLDISSFNHLLHQTGGVR